MYRALILSIALASPVHAQHQSILSESIRFARDELVRSDIALDELLILDTRRVRTRGDLHSRTSEAFQGRWNEAELRRVAELFHMQLGTVDSARTCIKLSSGRDSCTFRPARGVLAVGDPVIETGTATARLFMWTQPRMRRVSRETGEPIEIHYSRVYEIDFARDETGWRIVSVRAGPPGISLDK